MCAANYTTPHDLAPAMYTAVYTDDDPPVQNNIVGLMHMCRKMPMRSTHSSLPTSRASQSKGNGLDGVPPNTIQPRKPRYNNHSTTMTASGTRAVPSELQRAPAQCGGAPRNRGRRRDGPRGRGSPTEQAEVVRRIGEGRGRSRDGQHRHAPDPAAATC